MHATLTKFGYPDSAIAAFEHWIVVLRPQQVTLASLVLISKSDAHSFAALPTSAYNELEIVSRKIESGLHKFRPFDKINYIMLMMVDPHVHFHVLPRYQSAQLFGETTFFDAGWPGPPDLKSAFSPRPGVMATLKKNLVSAFEGIG